MSLSASSSPPAPPAVPSPGLAVATKGRTPPRRLRRLAVICWAAVGIFAAISLAACASVGVPRTGPSIAHGPTPATSSCPTPTPSAQGITPPATPPAVNGIVTTTADGLQEIDVRVGCGAVVQTGQTVVVEYSGWVQSTGQLFDSSFEHQPSECNGTVANTCSFPLNQGSLIQGWVEGIAGMKVGGTRRLIIPPALAYGAQGSPPVIPPNATLIFDITVVGVQ